MPCVASGPDRGCVGRQPPAGGRVIQRPVIPAAVGAVVDGDAPIVGWKSGRGAGVIEIDAQVILGQHLRVKAKVVLGDAVKTHAQAALDDQIVHAGPRSYKVTAQDAVARGRCGVQVG